MIRCIHFPLIVFLITWRTHGILGSDVDLDVTDTTCVGNNVTLRCTINPFTTVPSATWSRNGSAALTTCTNTAFCTQDDLTIDNVKYSFSGSSTGIYVSFQIQPVENEIEWICSHNATPYRYTFNVLSTCVVTTEGTTEGDSTCVGCWIAILLFILLCLFPPTVKILIILYLWYKYRYCKRIPEYTNIRIIITAQKQIILATKRINYGESQDISLCNSCHEIIIRVRAGVTIQCSFQVDGNMFALSFLITEDMLNARPGKRIKLPTMLEVLPKYETIQWKFNRKELDCKDQYYKTKVSPATYGVYDIEMQFQKQVMIFIQNMRVQGCYWKLMILFVVIDIVLAVICGIVIGLNRLKDGFCVEETVIVCVVLIPLIFFTVVEMVLIYFMLIKRTESKESSGSQDSDMVKITTSETITGSPNAETTTFITRTGSPSAENTTFTTGQNSRNWQPPIKNTAVNPDAHH